MASGDARRAAERVEFQLTYARSGRRRRFEPGLLEGPDVADAYGGTYSVPGVWENGDDMEGDDRRFTEQEWGDRYASYAVNEAIHEALEWFRVDGRPWLDPHGGAAEELYQLTGQLCQRLAELRAAHTSLESAGANN